MLLINQCRDVGVGLTDGDILVTLPRYRNGKYLGHVTVTEDDIIMATYDSESAAMETLARLEGYDHPIFAMPELE